MSVTGHKSTGVLVSGFSGRMGQELFKIIESSPDLKFCGELNRQGPQIRDEAIDVVVDFSLPEALDNVIRFCQDRGLPLVSGTTGLKPKDNSRLMDLSQTQAVFWSANMSFGVFIMNRLVEALSNYKLNFSYNMSETHHIHKKDAPSGTALQIEKTAKVNGLKVEDIESLREGATFGIHTFSAHNAMETLSITHEATSRQLFADGALQVARWIGAQKPGFYDMKAFVESSSAPMD